MWLIDTETLELSDTVDLEKHQYAILSHTWAEGEVDFQQMRSNQSAIKQKPGYKKIAKTCRLARSKGIPYAWVDTCCIDKNSSAGLTEAINSMFAWYQSSSVCFVYLFDLPSHEFDGHESMMKAAFPECRWFRRGWTLQELIAPEVVEFYDQRWNFIGTKSFLRKEISATTGIDVEVLENSDLVSTIPLGRRMSWAAHRRTTRVEDVAYCLLGIFNISMSVIYGEGPKAFLRLQEKIIKNSTDMSIFAWTSQAEVRDDRRPMYTPYHQQDFRGILARTPAEFVQCARLRHAQDPAPTIREFGMTNGGLRIKTALAAGPDKEHILNLGSFYCSGGGRGNKDKYLDIGIYLMKTESGAFIRCRASETYSTADPRFWDGQASTTVYIQKDLTSAQAVNYRTPDRGSFTFQFHLPTSFRAANLVARPAGLWDTHSKLFTLRDPKSFTALLQLSIQPKYWRFIIICGLIDPRANKPPVLISAGPRKFPPGELLPWGMILTDQDPNSKLQIEVIDKILSATGSDGEEAGLAALRERAFAWHLDAQGRLPILEMVNEWHVATDDEGEMRYYISILKQSETRGLPQGFRVGVYLEELTRIAQEQHQRTRRPPRPSPPNPAGRPPPRPREPRRESDFSQPESSSQQSPPPPPPPPNPFAPRTTPYPRDMPHPTNSFPGATWGANPGSDPNRGSVPFGSQNPFSPQPQSPHVGSPYYGYPPPPSYGQNPPYPQYPGAGAPYPPGYRY
jgi:hypothetical protein